MELLTLACALALSPEPQTWYIMIQVIIMVIKEAGKGEVSKRQKDRKTCSRHMIQMSKSQKDG